MKKIQLLSLSFLLSLCEISWAQSRIAVPSYQDPGSVQWNVWRALGASSVGIMIVNENNGDDTTYYPEIDQAIRNTRKKGIFVVGYVYTGYGQRDPGVVRKKVEAVFRNYLLDGIFFDEVPTDCNAPANQSPTNYLYYQALADYVRRQQAGARLVLLNPGTQPSEDCWMSIANILVTAESSSLQDYKHNYQPQAWFRRYPPERFWHIVYGVSSTAGLNEVMALSQQRGAAWVYVTNRGGGNPYDQPPAYWSLEGSEVAGQDVQAPYAGYRPPSNDENGNPLSARVTFRWRTVNGKEWRIFLDSDRNAGTGYRGDESGLRIGADFMLACSADGHAALFRYTGSGSDWAWAEVKAHARIEFPDTGLNLVEFDADALGKSQALDYQIRSKGDDGNILFTSYVVPLSLNSTSYTFDILDHP